jgi:hypothetical protein
MAPHQKNKTEPLFHGDKRNLLVYSLYLSISSASLFIAFNMLYNAYQGYIWSYTSKYVTNSLAIALVLFIACSLLLIGCYNIIKTKKYSTMLGAIGCLLLIIYPVYVFFIDMYVPYAYYYVLLLWTPALVVLLIAFYVWNTQKKST